MNATDNDSPVLQFRGMTWDSEALVTWFCAVSPVLQLLLLWGVAMHARLPFGHAHQFILLRSLPLLIRLHELLYVASLAFSMFAIARLIVVSIHRGDFKMTGRGLATAWVVYWAGWAAWIGRWRCFRIWGAAGGWIDEPARFNRRLTPLSSAPINRLS